MCAELGSDKRARGLSQGAGEVALSWEGDVWQWHWSGWWQGCGISQGIHRIHPQFLVGVTGWKEHFLGGFGVGSAACACRAAAGGKAPSHPWGMSVTGGTMAPGHQSDLQGMAVPPSLAAALPQGRQHSPNASISPNPFASLLWAASGASRTGFFACKPCLSLRIPAVLRGAGSSPTPGSPQPLGAAENKHQS